MYQFISVDINRPKIYRREIYHTRYLSVCKTNYVTERSLYFTQPVIKQKGISQLKLRRLGYTITGLDRPLGLQEVETPRFLDNRHMKAVRLSASSIGHLYHHDIFLLLFSVRSWIDSSAIVRTEGLSLWKIPETPLGIESEYCGVYTTAIFFVSNMRPVTLCGRFTPRERAI
jgi:hypothetical protein